MNLFRIATAICVGLPLAADLPKIPEGALQDQVPAMLQALLADRFGMISHKEDRLGTVYAMVVDKGGPKFHEVEAVAQRPGAPRNGTRFTFGKTCFKGNMTMARLGERLSNGLNHPVHYFPGLPGTYAIELFWTPDPAFEHAPGRANSPAGVFTAIREALGLKLEARKLPIETLVIDHIERVPTAN